MKAIDEILLEASYKKATREVEVCLQEGANVNCRGLFQTPLLNAVRNGDFATAKLLIDNGGDVNSTEFGTTPLIETILFGHKKVFDSAIWTNTFDEQYLKVLTLLLDSGADIKIEDGDGKSGLYHIVQRGLLDEFDDVIKKYNLFENDELQLVFQKIQEEKMQEKRWADAFSPVER